MDRKGIIKKIGMLVFLVVMGIEFSLLYPEEVKTQEKIKQIEIKSTYTPTTETHCNDGKCTLTLYSGYAPHMWDKFKNMSSLKDYFNVVYLKKDKRYNLEVEDFNYTHIKLKPIVKDNKELNKLVPIKTEGKVHFHTFKNLNERPTVFFQMGNVLAHNYSFGEHSTTIMLQEANTENLDDNYVRIEETTDYSDTAYLQDSWDTGDDEWEYSSFFKFDISSLPNGATIDSSDFYQYFYYESLDSGESLYLGAYHVYDVNSYNISGAEWAEDTIDGTNYPDASDEYNTTYESTNTISNGDSDAWYGWSVTNMIVNEYNKANNNVSIWILPYDKGGSPTLVDYVRFYSKEYTTDTTLRPYLNITYSTPDTEYPQYSLNSTNSTYAGKIITHSLYWEDNVDLDYTDVYLDNCSGSLDLLTTAYHGGASPAWVNFTVGINDTVGCTVRWCEETNDTAGNKNTTSCNNPFSYITTSPDTCTYSSGDWEIDCNDNCDETGINITGDLKIYSTASGTVNLTNVNFSTFQVNATDVCTITLGNPWNAMGW